MPIALRECIMPGHRSIPCSNAKAEGAVVVLLSVSDDVCPQLQSAEHT